MAAPTDHGDRHLSVSFFRCFLSYCSALKEMNNDRNHRKQQQQVNQRTRDVKHQKPAEPQKQQNDKQHQEHTPSFGALSIQPLRSPCGINILSRPCEWTERLARLSCLSHRTTLRPQKRYLPRRCAEECPSRVSLPRKYRSARIREFHPFAGGPPYG